MDFYSPHTDHRFLRRHRDATHTLSEHTRRLCTCDPQDKVGRIHSLDSVVYIRNENRHSPDHTDLHHQLLHHNHYPYNHKLLSVAPARLGTANRSALHRMAPQPDIPLESAGMLPSRLDGNVPTAISIPHQWNHHNCHLSHCKARCWV